MANLSGSLSLGAVMAETVSGIITMNRAFPGLQNINLTSYFYESFRQVPNAAPDSLPLPKNPCQIVVIRNAAGAGGSNLNVKFTPNGGASASVVTLTPGSALALFESDLTSGVTDVTLQGASAIVPTEVLLAG